MNRIAIIGSGIAGLTFAWLAKQSGNHVTLFESQPRLGMDAHSINLDLETGPGPCDSARVDVPPRMFNSEDWPLLTRLYESLGVESQVVDASKSFTVENESSWLQLGNQYRGGFSVSALLNSKVRGVAAETARLQAEVTEEALRAMTHELTLGQFLDREAYSDDFIFDFLFPGLASTVLTCSYSALLNYPAKVALFSLLNQVDRSPLRRTSLGTADVVDRLIVNIDDVRLSTRLTSVSELDNHVTVSCPDDAENRFDQLIVATQANSAAKLLSNDSKLQRVRGTLEAFEYENVSVVVHRDDSFMPPKASDRMCFNFNSRQDRTDAMCTMWLNRFYPEWSESGNVYQTIRPTRMPAKDTEIVIAAMQRPIVSQKSLSAVKDLQTHNAAGSRVSFIGSYAAATVPLLESGVASAFDLAGKMGMEAPSDLFETASD